MLRRLVLLCCLLGLLVGPSRAVDVIVTTTGTVSGGTTLTITEVDGVPSGIFATLKFSNGTVVDNGDGSATITTGGDVTLTGAQELQNKRIKPRSLVHNAALTPTVIDCALYDTVYWNEVSQPTQINPPFNCTPYPDQRLLLTLFSTVARPITLSEATNGFSAAAGVSLPTTTIAGQYLVIETLWSATTSRWLATKVSQYRPIPKVLTDTATIAVDANTPDGLFTLANLSQTAQFLNPTGTFTDMQYLEIRVTCAVVQTVNWDTKYSGNATLGLPTACSGGNIEDHWAFRRNAAADRWVIIANTQGALPLKACTIAIGEQDGPVLVDAKLTQLRQCVPINSVGRVKEIGILADAGTPAVMVIKLGGVGVNIPLLTGNLTAGPSGTYACARKSGDVVSQNGVTTCAATLQSETWSGEVSWGLGGGVAGGVAKSITLTIFYSTP